METIRDLGDSRQVCIEGDEGGRQVKLSGFEVLGVRMLHHDCCNDDIGNTFVTDWQFNRVIKTAHRICETGSSDSGTSKRDKDESSFHVRVTGKKSAMLLLRVVDDTNVKGFVETLEVGSGERGEQLHIKKGVIKVTGKRRKRNT